MQTTVVYRYSIGGDNRISWVSDEWLAFARQNSAPELTRGQVVGRSLFSFISGAETEFLHYLLLDEVRTRRMKLAVPFRCDGPAVRRYMRLVMVPLEEGGVAYEGSVIREEPRDTLSFLDLAAARTDAALTICSWCKTMQVGKEWLDVEEAARRLDLLQLPRLPQQNHGVCPQCGDRLRRSTARLAAGLG